MVENDFKKLEYKMACNKIVFWLMYPHTHLWECTLSTTDIFSFSGGYVHRYK